MNYSRAILTTALLSATLTFAALPTVADDSVASPTASSNLPLPTEIGHDPSFVVNVPCDNASAIPAPVYFLPSQTLQVSGPVTEPTYRTSFDARFGPKVIMSTNIVGEPRWILNIPARALPNEDSSIWLFMTRAGYESRRFGSVHIAKLESAPFSLSIARGQGTTATIKLSANSSLVASSTTLLIDGPLQAKSFDSSGSYALDLSTLTPGAHTFTAFVATNDGGAFTTEPISFHVDPITLATGKPDAQGNVSIALSASGFLQDGSEALLVDGNGYNAKFDASGGTSLATHDMKPGAHDVAVTYKTLDGATLASVPATVKVDPVTVALSPPDDKGIVAVKLSSLDAAQSLQVDGQPNAAAFDASGIAKLNTLKLASGDHTVSATLTTTKGTTVATSSVALHLAPLITDVAIDGGNTIDQRTADVSSATVRFKVSPSISPKSIDVMVDGKTVATQPGANGKISFDPSNLLAGTVNLVVSANVPNEIAFPSQPIKVQILRDPARDEAERQKRAHAAMVAAYIDKADAAVTGKDYDGAIAIYTQAIEAGLPAGTADVHGTDGYAKAKLSQAEVSAGIAATAAQKYDAAVDYLTRAVAADNSNADAKKALADSLAKKKAFDAGPQGQLNIAYREATWCEQNGITIEGGSRKIADDSPKITSNDQEFSFGHVVATNPHLAKMLAAMDRYVALVSQPNAKDMFKLNYRFQRLLFSGYRFKLKEPSDTRVMYAEYQLFIPNHASLNPPLPAIRNGGPTPNVDQ